MAKSVNPGKLHQELKMAGLPVVGVSSLGRVDYSRSLSSFEQITAKQVVAAHDPSATNKEVFLEKLALASLSKDDVLYALWKYFAEGDATEKDTLLKSMN
jgi:hypothetical protein